MSEPMYLNAYDEAGENVYRSVYAKWPAPGDELVIDLERPAVRIALTSADPHQSSAQTSQA